MGPPQNSHREGGRALKIDATSWHDRGEKIRSHLKAVVVPLYGTPMVPESSSTVRAHRSSEGRTRAKTRMLPFSSCGEERPRGRHPRGAARSKRGGGFAAAAAARGYLQLVVQLAAHIVRGKELLLEARDLLPQPRHQGPVRLGVLLESVFVAVRQGLGRLHVRLYVRRRTDRAAPRRRRRGSARWP